MRRVVYNRLEDVPWLLRTDGTSAPNAGLRAEARPFIPTQIATKATQLEEEEEPAEEHPGEGEENEDVLEQAVDVDSITQAMDAEQTLTALAAHSPAEISAAAVIATVYKRYKSRTHVRKQSPLQEMRRRIYAEFAGQARAVDWLGRYYRMLFLGPAAHLRIAVELMKNHLYEARGAARKRFNLAQHLELENVQTSLTQLTCVPVARAREIRVDADPYERSRLFKDANRLHQALAPTADVHRARDVEKLKELACEAEALMQSLPPSATQECEKDMKIALKGIVAVRKAPVKKRRPALNVEDDGVYDHDDYDESADFTPDETRAAAAIERAYVRFLARRRLREGEEKRREELGKFAAQARRIDWPHRKLRMLYLGPAVHLLLAVQHMQKALADARHTVRVEKERNKIAESEAVPAGTLSEVEIV